VSILPQATILEHGLFTSDLDFFRLDVVDWYAHRNVYWPNPEVALKAVNQWLIGRAFYTILQLKLDLIPEQPNCPKWSHSGSHVGASRWLWNWFHSAYKGELQFSDEPDFFGYFELPGGGRARFTGDIGVTAPHTFLFAWTALTTNDVWISLRDNDHLVIIEAAIDIRGAVSRAQHAHLTATETA
jgi:hypothetical protein